VLGQSMEQGMMGRHRIQDQLKCPRSVTQRLRTAHKMHTLPFSCSDSSVRGALYELTTSQSVNIGPNSGAGHVNCVLSVSMCREETVPYFSGKYVSPGYDARRCV
jgi:hypothetical protein